MRFGLQLSGSEAPQLHRGAVKAGGQQPAVGRDLCSVQHLLRVVEGVEAHGGQRGGAFPDFLDAVLQSLQGCLTLWDPCWDLDPLPALRPVHSCPGGGGVWCVCSPACSSIQLVVCTPGGSDLHLQVRAEGPAEGAVVLALQVTQQVAVGWLRQVNHILVLQESTQLGVGCYILSSENVAELLYGGALLTVLKKGTMETTVKAIYCPLQAAVHHVQVEVDEERVEDAAHLLRPGYFCF